MEVNNLNENEYVPLPLYYRIAQIVFSSTGPVGVEYAKSTGSYQSVDSSQFDELVKNWQESSMLPRSPKDAIDLQTYRKQQIDMLAA